MDQAVKIHRSNVRFGYWFARAVIMAVTLITILLLGLSIKLIAGAL